MLCCFNEKCVQHETEYYEFLAPSVFHLETTFMREIKNAGLDSNVARIYDLENLSENTHGVIRRRGAEVTCPIDGKRGAAYVHCINGNDHVGTATHMLSYAWGYRVIDIVETLSAFCKGNKLDPKKTYIWICCLCNNQHRVFDEVVPFERFQSIFNKRVKGVKNILAMMAPWNRPSYLKRVWCIFEMYTANADDECNIEIVMPPIEKDRLLLSLTIHANETGKDGIDDIFDALANTNVELAEASTEADKVNILKLVEEGPGYHAFNVKINQLMREWVKDTVIQSSRASEEIECTNDQMRREIAIRLSFYGSYFSKNGMHKDSIELHKKSLNLYKALDIEDEDTVARCYNNIGTEYESMGEYEKALESHKKCVEIFEVIYGTDHPNTSVSYFNIGFVHRKLNQNDKALELLTKSLEIDKKVKGENHVDTATSYTNIGRIKQAEGDLDGALEMFNKTLTIVTATYGKDHPETGVAYGDVGLLLHLRKDFDAAIRMHEKTKKIQEAVLGEKHPDTAQVYQNLGGAYYEKKDFVTSLKYLEKALLVFEESLGTDHPKTLNGKDWVEVVKEAQEMVNA